VTEPPGEFMYKVIAFSGASDSRKRSWATMAAETVSFTSPLRQMIRSWRSLEKISEVRQPPPTVSVMNGTGVHDLGSDRDGGREEKYRMPLNKALRAGARSILVVNIMYDFTN